jgi:hypothetical protein
MNRLKISALLLCVLCTLAACKKEEEEKTPPPSTIPTDMRCTGNSSNSYYPMALNNAWTYPAVTIGGSNIYNLTIYRTREFNGLTYFEVVDTRGGNTIYLRTDSIGDIYEYTLSNPTERLFIPAAPFIDQQWNTSNDSFKKVTDLSATVTTPYCTYTNCLEITWYSVFNNVTTANMKLHYKKGFGMVSYTTLGLGGLTFSLTHLLLY